MKKKYIDWVNKLTKALWGITFEEAVQEAGVIEIEVMKARGSYSSLEEAEADVQGITRLIQLLSEGKRVPTLYLKNYGYYLTLVTYQKLGPHIYCSWGAMNDLSGACIGLAYTPGDSQELFSFNCQEV